ncbi:nitroreductase family deazaflavin-dependent oxidoreductase [Kribbia dieselivorans]|uniref:nitroreductase family deazaflavin-dependent oxidoreductase n=1 Tax=Kribbia dieselivorans TaxID=331526 RepID=UPI00083806E5|nr:nitroreductase family deazaflavin-dependent oxidoreductase [Kribbia dieselivorans]
MATAKRQGPPRIVVRLTEPLATWASGRRVLPLFAVMHHVGRRSGASYATPIAVVPSDPTVILIGLVWGTDTNWARNVIAAGGATLRWRGRDVTLTRPRIVDAATAAQVTRGLVRRGVERSGGLHYLLLDVVGSSRDEH